jgi:ribosomal protein S18 acetylase RimI-like enzyme
MLSERAFVAPGDVDLIVEFSRRVRPPERWLDYPSVVDLPAMLARPENMASLRLWFAGPDLAAWAYVDAFNTLRFDLDLSAAPPELEAAVVAWGREWVRSVGGTTMQATCHEGDAARQRMFERQGLWPNHDAIVHLRRVFGPPLDPPILPRGFRLRPIAGEDEAAAVAALHRLAFGTTYLTTERRLALMRGVDYDSTLDLVVETPDGNLAAYGLGSVNHEENATTGENNCYTDLFATHPDWRGLGLARALLLRLLGLLQPRGFTAALIVTDSHNAAMQQVAARAGFRLATRTLRFSRAVGTP